MAETQATILANASLVDWFHADDLALANNARVATWTGKKGTIAAQVVAAAQPYYTTPTALGQGAVRTDQTGGMGVYTTIPPGLQGTIIAIDRQISNGSWREVIVGAQTFSGTYRTLELGRNDQRPAIAVQGLDLNTSGMQGNGWGGYLKASHIQVFTYACTGMNVVLKLRENGETVYSDTYAGSYSPPIPSTTPFGIGTCGQGGTATGEDSESDIFDVLFFNAVLTDPQIAAIETYFSELYHVGLDPYRWASLPSPSSTGITEWTMDSGDASIDDSPHGDIDRATYNALDQYRFQVNVANEPHHVKLFLRTPFDQQALNNDAALYWAAEYVMPVIPTRLSWMNMIQAKTIDGKGLINITLEREGLTGALKFSLNKYKLDASGNDIYDRNIGQIDATPYVQAGVPFKLELQFRKHQTLGVIRGWVNGVLIAGEDGIDTRADPDGISSYDNLANIILGIGYYCQDILPFPFTGYARDIRLSESFINIDVTPESPPESPSQEAIMTIGYLKNARLHVGALDLSGLVNTVSLPSEAAELDCTPINTTGATAFIPGPLTHHLEFQGWREYGAGLSDQLLWEGVGGAEAPFSVWGPSLVDGGLAWFGRLNQTSYQTGSKVGELEVYTVAGPVTAPLVRGNSLASGSKTATGVGSAFQLGSITAAQSVYAVLHVLSFTGITSISVKIQSATAAGFTTPHDQLTFATKTAVGSEYKALAGANADTYWRAIWTIVGTGSAIVAVTMGIQ